MAATGGFVDPLIATVLSAFVVGVAAAVMRTVKKRQEKDQDEVGLREFFFDTPENPRTGVPAKTGWTTMVNARLDKLTATQDRIAGSVTEILREVKPPVPGGKNLRSEVKQVVEKVTDDDGN